MKIYKSKTAESNILYTYDILLEMWRVEKQEFDIPTNYGTTHVIKCGSE